MSDGADRRQTYAFPVLICNVTMLERVLDFLLVLGGQLVEAINHVCVALGGLNQVLNLLGCDAAPAKR